MAVASLAQITGMETKRKQMGWSEEQFYAFPRLKKLPIFDAAHVRNAMARFNQTQGMSSGERATAKNKIARAAGKFGIEVGEFAKLKESSSTEKYEASDKALIIRDAVLMSQGIWNDVYYDKNEISKAFDVTDWSNRDKTNLFLDHQDQKASEWIGDVQDMHFDSGTLYGDLYIYDPDWMDKLNNGKPKVGISPKVKGDVDEKDKTMHNFTFENFSLVINPAVKTAYINNMETLKVEEEEIGLSEQEEQEIIKIELEEALKEEKIEEAIKMEDSFENYADLLELFELKNLSVSKVFKKAKELRQKDESLRDALRRAAALLQEEGEEEVKPEAPKEEPEAPAEEAEKMKEDKKDEEIKTLSKKVEELTAKLNEPEVKVLKKVESKLEEDIDKGMLAYLQELDKESFGGR